MENVIQNNKLVAEDNDTYFGWCNVKGCHNEGCSGGTAWRDTGYWAVCYKHSADFRAGLPQPEMKESALKRESMRGEDGIGSPDAPTVEK